MSVTDARRVAVIGGGWAGCTAAVALAESGCHVTLFESRTTPGGRARRLEADGKALDSGQHILLGAYTETLRMMKKVGVDPKAAFLRLPLQICYPPHSADMSFVAASLPAPLHLAAALFRARGLDSADRMALMRFMSAARWMAWRLHEDFPVVTLLERFGQTQRLYNLLWRPLCIAALNTLPEEASAQVFLRVLKDSIGAGRSASDMLLPRCNLSALFPEKAAGFVQASGGKVLIGRTVRSLQQTEKGWQVEGQDFDAVVVATSATAASALLSRQMDMTLFDALDFEPIHTCYFGYAPHLRLPRALFALADDPASGQWGQFVFDRGWLEEGAAGVLAVVISTSSATAELNRQELEQAVTQQLAGAFGMPELLSPLWTRTISDRQATFVCKPGLARPAITSGKPGLFFAGDYVESPYPGTIEAAVRNGTTAAKAVMAEKRGNG